MFCSKCGKDMGTGSFCPYCGAAALVSPVVTKEKKFPLFALIATAFLSLLYFIELVDYATAWLVFGFLALQALIVFLIIKKKLPMFIAVATYATIELLDVLFGYGVGRFFIFFAIVGFAAFVALLMFVKSDFRKFFEKFFFIPAAAMLFARNFNYLYMVIGFDVHFSFWDFVSRSLWTVALVATYFFVVKWFADGEDVVKVTAPQPIPQPVPVAQPVPQPAPAPQPVPAAQPAPQPIPQPVPAPATEGAVDAVIESVGHSGVTPE